MNIDEQFDRAVAIVQGLPKTGPIQTSYEEKLAMYSLYKQATVGNVQGSRPGMWDMLGRAKWDAWEKHKDLDSSSAKLLYVETLQKVLRKYSDKTTARDLVRELETNAVDPSQLVMSGTLSRTRSASSSGSSGSDSPLRVAPQPQHPNAYPSQIHPSFRNTIPEESDPEQTSEAEITDDDHDTPLRPVPIRSHSGIPTRPLSSVSSQNRYRTPIGGSLATSPPPHIPSIQPMPGFQTPSAFESSRQTPSISYSAYPTSSSYPLNPTLSHSSLGQIPPAVHPGYRSSPAVRHPHPTSMAHAPPPHTQMSASPLERAVENIQDHLAAITERLERLERGSSPTAMGRYQAPDGHIYWDPNQLGMWSLVFNPLSRILRGLQYLGDFLGRPNAAVQSRSPTLVVLRRLILDTSFLLFVFGVLRFGWRRSGRRRKEVKAALRILWRAVVGSKEPRVMVDRGV
ncbi:ACBP-domain-containing protein [Sistotremastrum niveocremeum HHB9708]|uniref:ACBP-domain-containing protein n=2 Tax=Sistotremastraceae TaxID=3402574 RepID=A0A164ZUN7_9AGAM|nr:ACBP-domain-containing protein [Sistotremastrum niveocremeum HHB9708]KZT35534.1 ACBP-domain-containing protein [Sistotremastrum suecicum HHB10207 ss-3]